jgi:endoglucanase
MRLRKWTVCMVTAMTAAAASVFVSTQPASAATSGPWVVDSRLIPSGPWTCMEVTGGSTVNSAVAQMYTCHDDPNVYMHQKWYMEEVPGTSYWRIKNAKSGKCLNVQGASTVNSAKIIQYTCGGSTTYNDQWYLSLWDCCDWYHIINRKSGKCLNVQGANPESGADLIQYTCTGAAYNDQWSWYPPQ